MQALLYISVMNFWKVDIILEVHDVLHSGVEEAILHWSGKFWTLATFSTCGKRATDRHTVCSYCVKYNQHAKHANYYRGSVACSSGTNRITDALRLNLGTFLRFIQLANYSNSYIHWFQEIIHNAISVIELYLIIIL